MTRTATVEQEATRKPRKPATNGHAKRARKASVNIDEFGFRKGSLKSKAAAMYAAKDGATLAQVKAKLKSSQFNLLTELKQRKVKIQQTLVPGAGARKVTRYHIVIK